MGAGFLIMKIFHCDHCQGLVFFENVKCLTCGQALAYLPEAGRVATLKQGKGGRWWAGEREYRLCKNYNQANVCNWAVEAGDGHEFCGSCRLTRVIPDLKVAGNREAWYKLEVAKRRLVYGLLGLGLPVRSLEEDPQHGLAFEFLEDPGTGTLKTGHENGVIVINVAETDDAWREQTRNMLNEPYRTVLGHFRHESGHYYWDRLIKFGPRLKAFRGLFGDERQDYAVALQQHYALGAPGDWMQRFVSEYASAHPWEDWAETWAHYLHIVDTLEMAGACGLTLEPARRDEPQLTARDSRAGTFEQMMKDWSALTYVLNNLNRGMGLPDGYPFALSQGATGKLRFVHETVMGRQWQ
jgi:hypothetical protein